MAGGFGNSLPEYFPYRPRETQPKRRQVENVIRFVLCRHGESLADLEPRRIEGSADFPLSDLGHQQAAALAAWLPRAYQIDRLIASPLQRAQQTAVLIAAATGIGLELDHRLAERSTGLLAGLTRAEADQHFPVQHPVKVHHRPPEGESYLDHFRRVAEFYYETYYDQSLAGKTLCIVAHGGTLNCLLDAALGLPPLAEVDFSCADTCIHELEIQPGGRVRVKRLNATPHLESLA